MPDAIAPLLVDRREAARLLCCCPRTIDNIVKRGELATVPMGRAVRFDVEDLKAWVSANKLQVATADKGAQ